MIQSSLFAKPSEKTGSRPVRVADPPLRGSNRPLSPPGGTHTEATCDQGVWITPRPSGRGGRAPSKSGSGPGLGPSLLALNALRSEEERAGAGTRYLLSSSSQGIPGRSGLRCPHRLDPENRKSETRNRRPATGNRQPERGERRRHAPRGRPRRLIDGVASGRFWPRRPRGRRARQPFGSPAPTGSDRCRLPVAGCRSPVQKTRNGQGQGRGKPDLRPPTAQVCAPGPPGLDPASEPPGWIPWGVPRYSRRAPMAAPSSPRRVGVRSVQIAE
jgi:hypothetical protein